MMTLAEAARELVEALAEIVEALEGADRPEWADDARTLAHRLRPGLAELETAVLRERRRSDAEQLVMSLAEVMEEVRGAATKGDMDIIPDRTLGRFLDLSTIFRESRFAGQSL